MVPKLYLLDNYSRCILLENKFHRRLYHISISNHLASIPLHMQVLNYKKCMELQKLAGKAVEKTVEKKVGSKAERTDYLFHN
jgi:hypothetical protein